MQFWQLYLAFLISCSVLLLIFRKKDMGSAAALFFAIGLYVGICSASMKFFDIMLANYAKVGMHLALVSNYMLGISSALFAVIIVVISVATLVSFVIAVRKIVELIKNHSPKGTPTAEYIFNLPKRAKICTRRIFLLFCRMID